MAINTYLQEQYPIEEFDPHISFIEETHEYFIDGKKYDGSCTGFCHSFFSHFDADKVIANMVTGKSWKPGHKYWGMTPDQIKAQWDNANKDAAPDGTKMHAKIEKFYNIPEL